jgi:hypothetical protein
MLRKKGQADAKEEGNKVQTKTNPRKSQTKTLNREADEQDVVKIRKTLNRRLRLSRVALLAVEDAKEGNIF